MRRAVIVSAVRTGVGKYNGQWAPIVPEKLAGAVIKEAVARAKIDPAEIEDVIMGNLYAQHGNIARVAALEAGLPLKCGAMTVDRQCGSSVQAIYDAALNIMAGNGDVYVAAGLEHMTREPWQLNKPTEAFQIAGPSFVTTRLAPDEYGNERMGITAEKVAAMYKLTRRELDEYALESQKRAARATSEGVFKEQIVPVEITTKKKAYFVDQDEIMRPDVTLEGLSNMTPAFVKDGIVTAGNSCPWSDGAAAVVMMSEERARDLGLEPMGIVRSFAIGGIDPKIMGLGPTVAVPKALQRAGITADDLDVIELNEAFAAQVIPCMRELDFSHEKTNPNGGAIALGHPLGATGTVLTTKLLYEMKSKGHNLGLVTMCMGGGQGAALVLER